MPEMKPTDYRKTLIIEYKDMMINYLNGRDGGVGNRGVKKGPEID